MSGMNLLPEKGKKRPRNAENWIANKQKQNFVPRETYKWSKEQENS